MEHFLPDDTVQGSLKFTAIPKKSLPSTKVAFAKRVADGEVLGFTTREGAVVLPFEDLNTARAGFAATFQSLDFSTAYRATMDHIDTTLSGNLDFVGVHIRRGDVIRNANTSEGYWHGQFVPDAIYFAALDALVGPSVQFVFFCDDPEVLASYQSRYTDALTAPQITGADGQPALHVDLAEMYLMSRCARILCPRSSAFSTTAADLSGVVCEPVEDLLSPNQMSVAMTTLAQDIKLGVSAFHSVGDFKQSLNALMKYHAHVAPKMSLVEVAASARLHDVTTIHLLENTLKHALNTDDLMPISWLEDMVRNYAVHHVSALGDSYAALAYARMIEGDRELGMRHLGWANWFYPESPFVSYLTSAMIGSVGLSIPCLSPDIYAELNAKSAVPPHKGLRFLHNGPFSAKINKLNQLNNHIAPFMVMDWLEFVNPKTRRRLQMRSSLPRDVTIELPDNLAALNAVTKSAAPSAITVLENHAQNGDPLALKRLATGYFRVGQNDTGLTTLRHAFEQSNENPAYLAAYGVRLLEFGRSQEAVSVFDMLAEQQLNWADQNPAVTYAHAQALSGIKEFAKSAEIIQRNLDFANSCLVSNTLKRQLQQYL